jgi:hypothetical protein
MDRISRHEQRDDPHDEPLRRPYDNPRRTSGGTHLKSAVLRLGGRLLAARCRQPNEQSAAVDAAPLPRDLQAPGSAWLRRTVHRPGMPGRCPMRTRARYLRRPGPGRS